MALLCKDLIVDSGMVSTAISRNSFNFGEAKTLKMVDCSLSLQHKLIKIGEGLSHLSPSPVSYAYDEGAG